MEERAHYATNFRFKYSHPRASSGLDYYSTSSTVMVTQGALNLTFYLPADAATENAFRETLKGAENDVSSVASWRKKAKLK